MGQISLSMQLSPLMKELFLGGSISRGRLRDLFLGCGHPPSGASHSAWCGATLVSVLGHLTYVKTLDSRNYQ